MFITPFLQASWSLHGPPDPHKGFCTEKLGPRRGSRPGAASPGRVSESEFPPTPQPVFIPVNLLVSIPEVLPPNEMSFFASASEMSYPDNKNLLLKAYLGIIGSITSPLVALFPHWKQALQQLIRI